MSTSPPRKRVKMDPQQVSSLSQPFDCFQIHLNDNPSVSLQSRDGPVHFIPHPTEVPITLRYGCCSQKWSFQSVDEDGYPTTVPISNIMSQIQPHLPRDAQAWVTPERRLLDFSPSHHYEIATPLTLAHILPTNGGTPKYLQHTDGDYQPHPLRGDTTLNQQDIIFLPVRADMVFDNQPAPDIEVPAFPTIIWPCRIHHAANLTLRDLEVVTVHPPQCDDPLMAAHGDAHMDDERCLLRACHLVHQVYESSRFHDPTLPLVGSTGVGKSLAARRACHHVQQRADSRATYLCLPRVRGDALLSTWPPTTNHHLQALSDLFPNIPASPPELVLNNWVRSAECLIVAMILEVADPIAVDFDNIEHAERVYTRARGFFDSFQHDVPIITFTDHLVRISRENGLNFGSRCVAFIDEIGLFLHSADSTLPSSRSALTLEFPPGRPLSILRALRHAARNLWEAGLKVVLVCLGTEAGALNCHDYPSLLEAYRPNPQSRLRFEYTSLKSSVVFPACVCMGEVQYRNGVDAANLVQGPITTELACLGGSQDDTRRILKSRPLWFSYLSGCRMLGDWIDKVKGKVIDVVKACPTGVFGLLLAGLGPNLSSGFSTVLLRHGFARVAHHPVKMVRQQRVPTFDLRTAHHPLVLRNPRDPVIANTFWRHAGAREMPTIETLRELLSLPVAASGMGVFFGEPFGIFHLLYGRAIARRGSNAFVLEPVTFTNLVQALENEGCVSSFDLGAWADIEVSFTHVVDLPMRITADTIREAYIDGVIFRMPPNTPNIDYLAVGKRRDRHVLFGIQVRSGGDPKELIAALPMCITRRLIDGGLNEIECNFILLSLCREAVRWGTNPPHNTGFVDLQGDSVHMLYDLADERRRAVRLRTRMYDGQRIRVYIPEDRTPHDIDFGQL
eukprot:gnl/Dysnectes_brevis/738_a811_1950.p1 GENE.gnl/Dysnectes_brevis/738_a811_1950~~gnl/Dysnectes_brevis/738_a811_1950.p1  ORF type:complete len:903 (+),score=144.78 gnl/Dysnectes_brevis/738_a811_1950:2-2710(+)